MAVAAVTLLIAFIFWEQRTAEPILPLRLFNDRIFTVANLMAFLLGMVMFGAIIYLPVYFQLVKGLSATESGLLMLPMMGSLLVTSILGGQLVSRTGHYRVLVVVGSVSMVFGMWLFTHLGLDTTEVQAGLYMLPVGIGMGCVMQNLVLSVQNAVSRDDMGTATGAVNFFRSMGAAFGTALFGAVLTSRLNDLLPRLVPAAKGQRINASIVSAPVTVRTLPEPVQKGISEAFVLAVHAVFDVGVVVALVCLATSFFLRELPLRVSSHLGAELAESAPAGPVAEELPAVGQGS